MIVLWYYFGGAVGWMTIESHVGHLVPHGSHLVLVLESRFAVPSKGSGEAEEETEFPSIVTSSVAFHFPMWYSYKIFR
jgi:hypothetical protein